MLLLYIVLGLFAVLLIAASLLPKSYNVEKNIIIKRPADYVMQRISDLNYYSQWNPWQQSDPSAKSTITGTAGQSGHKYAWEGKKVGVGSLTLLSMDAKHIHFDLQFIKPMNSKASDNWLFESWGDGSETKVTWQNSGELPFPIGRLMGPMISGQLNKQFVQGLESLKALCEK
ncbi:MAG TPA: SRPBCC family protein [Chitinophagaceae bacterium]|nr:SRPBCC family protein [Chitinophagaceae bacterium]